MSKHEQSVIELIGAFRQALGSRPSRRRARSVLRALATGEAAVDADFRRCAEVVCTLALCRPLLLAGHPRGHLPRCAAN